MEVYVIICTDSGMESSVEEVHREERRAENRIIELMAENKGKMYVYSIETHELK